MSIPELDRIFLSVRQNYMFYQRVQVETKAVLGIFPMIASVIPHPIRKDYKFITLLGTLPIIYMGSGYNIPILIQFPYGYPKDPPLLFTDPSPDMMIVPNHPYAKQDRTIIHPTLSSWKDSSNILIVLQALERDFSIAPPLKRRMNDISDAEMKLNNEIRQLNEQSGISYRSDRENPFAFPSYPPYPQPQPQYYPRQNFPPPYQLRMYEQYNNDYYQNDSFFRSEPLPHFPERLYPKEYERQMSYPSSRDESLFNSTYQANNDTRRQQTVSVEMIRNKQLPPNSREVRKSSSQRSTQQTKKSEEKTVMSKDEEMDMLPDNLTIPEIEKLLLDGSITIDQYKKLYIKYQRKNN